MSASQAENAGSIPVSRFNDMKMVPDKFLIIVFCCVVVIGCQTIDPIIDTEYVIMPLPEASGRGIYHKVRQGETLWRIAKAYDISVKEIMGHNDICDVAQIEKNQLLFIPGAFSVKEIIVDTEETKNEFIWPIKGKVLNAFHDNVNGSLNRGIDIEAIEGEVVRAARTGKVVFADDLSGYGKTVIIDHLDDYYSVYSHIATLLVEAGDMVIKSKDIGYVGRYGYQRRPYLHFEIRKGNRAENPLFFLP